MARNTTDCIQLICLDRCILLPGPVGASLRSVRLDLVDSDFLSTVFRFTISPSLPRPTILVLAVENKIMSNPNRHVGFRPSIPGFCGHETDAGSI